MAKGKSVLTTGDVARICHVAPRTVSKWFDNGQLKGYRIPGSKDRRIPLSELIHFMKVKNMPTDSLAIDKIRVLIVDSDNGTAKSLADSLRSKSNYEVQIASSSFESGITAQKLVPHILLVNLSAKDIDVTSICKGIRSNEDLQATKIIALVNQLKDSETAALLQKGFDGYIHRSAEAADIVKKIEEITAII